MQKLYLLLLLLNLIKSIQRSILHITILFVLPILLFFITRRVDKASAADTVDLGSITDLVKPKLEKSLYSHPASRLGISNKMSSVKLSLCVVDRWANDSLFSKNKQFFHCLYTTWKIKMQLLQTYEKNFQNVSDGV